MINLIDLKNEYIRSSNIIQELILKCISLKLTKEETINILHTKFNMQDGLEHFRIKDLKDIILKNCDEQELITLLKFNFEKGE